MQNAKKKIQKCLILIIFLLIVPSITAISNVVCGEVLTSDVVMNDSLLNCDSTDGLIINASDITLDCNGFEISSGVHIDNGILLAENNDNITIKNCEITNFLNGINAKICDNKTNTVILDTKIANSSVSLDFWDDSITCGGANFFMIDLTMTNVNLTPNKYSLDINIDGGNFNNIISGCTIKTASGFPNSNNTCEAGVYWDNIRNVNVNGWSITNFDIGFYLDAEIATSGKGRNNILNNLFFNISDYESDAGFGATGFGDAIHVIAQDSLLITDSTFIRGSILIDNGSNAFFRDDDDENLIAILIDNTDNVTVVDSIYPIGNETIISGVIFRESSVNVTTIVGAVSIDIISDITGQVINKITDNGGFLTLNLLEYKHNTTGVFNSTPYTVVATRGEQSFQLPFDIGIGKLNSLSFSGFSLEVFPLESAVNVVGSIAILIILIRVATSFFKL